jgi:Uncharacterised protein family (UPF0236)
MGGCPTGEFPGSLPRGRRKRGLQTDLQNEIVQEIATLLGRQSIADLDLEAVEMAVRRQALRLAARALEQRLNADTSDHAGPELPCPCGATAQYHGRHAKTFESVLGSLQLERAYYHCEQCQSGFCPRDRDLGLESFSLTPGVLRMTASAAALLSFEESSGLLRELAGVEVSTKQVERAGEALGVEIAVDEHQHVEAMGEVAPTMYLGMDGTGVPMRAEEVADRAGKQADGSAKTREAKLVTIWTAESRDEEDKPVRDPGSISYSAAIESAATRDTSPDLSDFAQRVLREATRRGFTEAARPVVLGDGSPWIWNTAAELFPQATQILDRFHAKEHLSKVGKAIYGDCLEGKKWIDLRYDELDKSGLKSLVKALHVHAGQSKEAQECIHYIWKNRRRMRYPELHKQGFCTSTGVVEAGCKVAIGTRLKRAGMHWTLRGANAIIALRCNKLSGRFEDFWERRSDQRKAAA